MNGRWSPERKAFLVRDLVRDYCQVYEGLEEQRRRFDCFFGTLIVAFL